jgi:multiple sugar transport system permease protein
VAWMKRNGVKISLVVAYSLLILLAVIDLIPFVWMVLSSFKSRGEILHFPPTLLPQKWLFSNYAKAWNAGGLNFGRMFLNSMICVIPGTFCTLVVSSLAGFGFSRIRFRYREVIFMIYLTSMMVPDAVTMIPQFMIFRNLGLMNSFFPIILPQLFGFAMQTFLMRQFFMTIPQDLEDAAVIDGCNRIKIWYKIFVPVSRPVVSAVVILTFQSYYNDFLKPLIYINDSKKFTVQLGLSSFRGMFNTQFDLLMAASVFALAPILVVYMLGQRYFVEGVVTSGIKG